MGKNNSYKNSKAWIKSMEFVTEIYMASGEFPLIEMYSLTSQIRNAAVLVPSTITQSFAFSVKSDQKKYLQSATGFLLQIQTMLEIAFNLEYLQKEKYERLILMSLKIIMLLNNGTKKIKR